jgi:hypothetical protein
MPFSDSVSISFSSRANLSKYGSYDIVAYAFNNDDDYLFNDTVRIYLENNQLDDALSIYPNPFTDQFTLSVQSGGNDNLTITVFNNTGTKFYEFEKEVTTGINTIVITDLDLSPAIYYIKIRGTTIDRTIPVVKLNN